MGNIKLTLSCGMGGICVKLDKLSLTQLKDICADLNIDSEEIRVKRKQPYVEKTDGSVL